MSKRSMKQRSAPQRRLVTKQAVKDILLSRQECKQYTSNLSAATTFALAGAMWRLAPIQQGDDIHMRSGDQIYLRSLRLQVTAYEATANQSETFRVIVLLDSMGSGGAIVPTDVLQTANFTSPYNAINHQRKRFHILSDRTFTLVGGTNRQEVTDIVDVNINRTCWFNDNTVNATNIGKNAPYALVIGSAANSDYFIQWGLCYTDS